MTGRARDGGAGGPTKYDAPGRADRYARRSPRRNAEEAALLLRLLSKATPRPEDVLDAPCGTGRVSALLLDEGFPVRAADLSPAMRGKAARALEGRAGFLGVHALDLRDPRPPGALVADLVVCFRFLHHVEGAAGRARVLAALSALARRHVLVSFFHPVSAHAAARALRRVATGRRGDRHAVTLSRLRAEARAAGLRLVASDALGRYRRDLWVALFTKETAPAPRRAARGS
jgi:SAM-dependent methyltransferase